MRNLWFMLVFVYNVKRQMAMFEAFRDNVGNKTKTIEFEHGRLEC